MLFKNIKLNKNIKDPVFDLIYLDKIKEFADIHFTPFKVSKTAARFLADKIGVKVLDIGAGAGKFCMIGAACTEGIFTGVEQRESLVLAAKQLTKHYKLTNISFIHSNIINISFKNYDAFYIYNPFYENISLLGTVDDEIEYKRAFYDSYSLYVNQQLSKMPIGTKLVTYFSYGKEVPDNYKIHTTAFDGKLKMWMKVN